MPSIPPFSFELNKNVYNINSSSIPYICTYLAPSSTHLSGETLEEVVNIADQLLMTRHEWNTIFMENASRITEFFTSGNPPLDSPIQQQQQQEIAQQRPISFINMFERDVEIENCIVVRVGVRSMSIRKDEWCYLHLILDCINVRLQCLQHIKLCYENRMNFFKRKFKMSHVKTLNEASNTLEKFYDRTSIVDNEIRYYATEFLFYSSLI